MTERRAFFLVCDDVLIALNGKFTIIGMYTGDIIIVSEQATVGQLVVLFQIETPVEKPFRKLELQVSLPGEDTPRRLDITQSLTGSQLFVPPTRARMLFRWPFLLAPVVLKPGAIEVKVLHEDGEIDAGKQWIVTTALSASPAQH
jgi:hypothetical protein